VTPRIPPNALLSHNIRPACTALAKTTKKFKLRKLSIASFITDLADDDVVAAAALDEVSAFAVREFFSAGAALTAVFFVLAARAVARFFGAAFFTVVLRVLAALTLRVVLVFLRAVDLEVVAMHPVYRLQVSVTSKRQYYNR
jgi:hypothetical protein